MPSKEEVARTLLRAKAGYDLGHPNVAPFVLGHVALPGNLEGAALIQDISPPRVLRHLEGNYGSMLRSREEFAELEDHGPPIKPYMDEVLKRSSAKYLGFVLLLKERGLVSFTRDHGESVTCFFVKKKNNMLRLVIDARRTNRRLADAPGVA